ncbi:MAG: DDE-type integrase/transposase/recombinase, partial [Gemmatimonadaceae bacterium]|nr:DDE-type integrase/transposase/recombinase [Gemmatimonadaceae bacterium]
MAWATDITYIRTWQGWLYLAVVIDLFSRKVVGWSTAPTIHRELLLNALAAAVKQRRPRGTIIHSDQGSQGGFNRSSQHLQSGGVHGTTRRMDEGIDREGGNALSGGSLA